MIFTAGLQLALGLLTAATPALQDDHAPTVRRLAATAQLAAQEYRIGVSDGRIVAAAEVEEAKLFLTEARRTAALLPPESGRWAAGELDALLALVGTTAPPDSIDVRVRHLTSTLAQRLGVSLDVMPQRVPTLARGAEVYQANCASCHGPAGRGDGAAGAGMDPPPADLSDFAALVDRSPLDFYQRVSIGVAGTAMPAFETRLSADDRWAVAVYSSMLRLPPPRGAVPPPLHQFATTARMSDAELLRTHAPGVAPDPLLHGAWLAAVRSAQTTGESTDLAGSIFASVREQLDSALALAEAGQADASSTMAFDAYMAFEQVEHAVRARDPGLADRLETSFAALRTRSAGGATPTELRGIRSQLAAELEQAERTLQDRQSPVNLFVQSLVILLREGLEAILVLGALIAFLVKTGAGHRRRDIHVGVGAAVGASLLTAVVLETIFQVSPAKREALEGITMLAATGMLFYVSYWLLSKMEVAKWNRFVRSRVQDAVSNGSALALASVAFLAVYREGFETVLFYKALFVSGGGGAVFPVVGGMVAGAVLLALVYIAINRFGVRIPLKPFFGFTSAFLYYMAFVFAGQGIAELQEGGLVPTTVLAWAPRIPTLGIYPTAESLLLQLVLVMLLVGGLLWTFMLEPRRVRGVTSSLVPEPAPAAPAPGTVRVRTVPAEPPLRVEQDIMRSLDRMDADLAEMRAEIERLKRLLTEWRRATTRR